MTASSRISSTPRKRYSWYARLFLANQRRRYGEELEPARLCARTPRVFAALSLLYGALDRRSSPIEPALRSLLTVWVSQINWCAFCVDINSATGLKRGVSEEQLAALAGFETSPLLPISISLRNPNWHPARGVRRPGPNSWCNLQR